MVYQRLSWFSQYPSFRHPNNYPNIAYNKFSIDQQRISTSCAFTSFHSRHTYIHTYIYTYIHTYIHIYIYIHIHMIYIPLAGLDCCAVYHGWAEKSGSQGSVTVWPGQTTDRMAGMGVFKLPKMLCAPLGSVETLQKSALLPGCRTIS